MKDPLSGPRQGPRRTPRLLEFWVLSYTKPDLPEDSMKCLSLMSEEHGIAGPVIFNSRPLALDFARLIGEDGAYEPVQLGRREFYKLVGDAAKDGFNVLFVNPRTGGRPSLWQLAHILASISMQESCPCGSGYAAERCCAAPPIHGYTARKWPVARISLAKEVAQPTTYAQI